jgi:release factor glutamine methyltransferase
MHPSIYSPEEDSYLISELIESRIVDIKNYKKLNYLEIGIGSGILLKTLQTLKIPKKQITGVDINKEAVKHCKSIGFNSKYSNLFSNIEDKYDVIIFNPPYLPDDKLEPFDSKLATTGGKHGSEIINEFLKQSKKHLEKDGKIFLLTSSLTKKINWNKYKKKLIGKKKIFFEELYVWELDTNLF